MASRRSAPPTSKRLDPGTEESAHAAEVQHLRQRLAELTAEASRNAALLQKAQDRELDLLRAGSLAELLERIVVGLKSAYQLDRVSLLLDDPQHEIRHLAGDDAQAEVITNVRHVDGFFTLAASLGGLDKPWLGSRLPAEVIRAIRPVAVGGSFALLPLPRADRRLGMLVLESRDAKRFRPELASDILGHLAAVTAMCLENSANRARLLRTGVTDFLTGFHNRRYLHARLREELARAQRTGGRVGLLMIDIDYFKAINDGYGHLAGDTVLREIARRIATQIRSSDTGARFGGDEFAVLVAAGCRDDLTRLASRLCAALSGAPIEISADASQTVTLSIGGAIAEPAPDERDYRSLSQRLMAEADAALYRVKSAGRNGFDVADRHVR